ncbi:MAG TPA: RNA-protein complex protein Nop10 [Nitrososphaerales archaeon]|nr:RNA-protein complex protein Nop10 [Nitrososphaerales archaeon]
MKSLILICASCHRYTMAKSCPVCGSPTSTAHPARFSPDDKYARYRSPLAYTEG